MKAGPFGSFILLSFFSGPKHIYKLFFSRVWWSICWFSFFLFLFLSLFLSLFPPSYPTYCPSNSVTNAVNERITVEQLAIGWPLVVLLSPRHSIKPTSLGVDLYTFVSATYLVDHYRRYKSPGLMGSNAVLLRRFLICSMDEHGRSCMDSCW